MLSLVGSDLSNREVEFSVFSLFVLSIVSAAAYTKSRSVFDLVSDGLTEKLVNLP